MLVNTDYDDLPDIIILDENLPNNANAKHLYTVLMNENVKESLEKNKFEIFEYIPELYQTINYDQNNPHHHLDLWYHTINAVAYSEKIFEIRLALLLHDISKPLCCVKDEKGISHYPGHNEKSAEMAREILTRLDWNTNFIDEVCSIIGVHDKHMTEEFIENNLDLAKKILQVQVCDMIAHNPEMNLNRQLYIQDATQMLTEIEKRKNSKNATQLYKKYS